MVVKYGTSNFIYSLRINALAELVAITIELEIHNIQIIAKDFNGFNSLCFRKLFVIFEFLSPFPWLSLTNDRYHWSHKDFLTKFIKNYFVKS